MTPEVVVGKQFGGSSIRFILATAAEWAASTRKLMVYDFAIISDDPTRYKRGDGTVSIGVAANGSTFSQLPYYLSEYGVGDFPENYSISTPIVAHAGGGQGSATPIISEINIVTTVAALGDSVLLPASGTPGAYRMTVINTGAKALAVYPQTGGAIDGLAANAAVYIAPGTQKVFISNTSAGANTWSTFSGQPSVTNRTAVAANATATLTADQMATGLITSTSAAATSLTTPTATVLAALLGAVRGSTFDFIIDNSVGANTVTLVLDASIVALTTITGENTLTVAATKAGIFRLIFTSPTAALIARVA